MGRFRSINAIGFARLDGARTGRRGILPFFSWERATITLSSVVCMCLPMEKLDRRRRRRKRPFWLGNGRKGLRKIPSSILALIEKALLSPLPSSNSGFDREEKSPFRQMKVRFPPDPILTDWDRKKPPWERPSRGQTRISLSLSFWLMWELHFPLPPPLSLARHEQPIYSAHTLSSGSGQAYVEVSQHDGAPIAS